MKPSTALAHHRDALRRLSARYPMRNPRVFGSAARGDDNERSDLDLLVDSTPDTTLLRLAEFQIEAEALLGVPVDVRTPEDLPPRIRTDVLREAFPL
jgi:predicted nucleotidyltransferase